MVYRLNKVWFKNDNKTEGFLLGINSKVHKNILIVAGEDKASKNNVFKDNAKTFVDDHLTKDNTIVIIEVADGVKKVVTMDLDGNKKEDILKIKIKSKDDLMQAIADAFGNEGLDVLIFESHASEIDIALSGVLPILLYEWDFSKYFGDSDKSNDSIIKLNKDAVLIFTGCNVGRGYEKSYAQKIANITKSSVYAFKEKSSQEVLGNLKGKKGTYQVPFSQLNKINKGSQIIYSMFTPIK